MSSLVIIIVYMTSFCEDMKVFLIETDSLTQLKLSQTGGISASDGGSIGQRLALRRGG